MMATKGGKKVTELYETIKTKDDHIV